MRKCCQKSKPEKVPLKVTVPPPGAIVMNVGDAQTSAMGAPSSNPVYTASAATMTQLHPPEIANDTVCVADEQTVEGERQALTGDGYVVSGDSQMTPAGLKQNPVGVPSAVQPAPAANATAKQPP